MAKHGSVDREALVPGTNPVTKEPMMVRRRVGKRVTGTSMDLLAGRKSTVGLSGLTDLTDLDPLDGFGDIDKKLHPDLVPVAHLVISGAELPEITILLPANTTPNIDKIVPVSNKQWAKPYGGMWTAPRTGATSSSWSDWCTAEEYLPKDEPVMKLWGMTVPDDAVIIKIDDVSEGGELYDAFHETPVDGLSRMYSLVDYEALAAAGVDAIWLSENGALSARGDSLTSDTVLPPFDLWDCETVLWLKPPTETKFSELGDVEIPGASYKDFFSR